MADEYDTRDRYYGSGGIGKIPKPTIPKPIEFEPIFVDCCDLPFRKIKTWAELKKVIKTIERINENDKRRSNHYFD